ncbi:MAG: LemA family protein [Coriobacteriia bacterium]|nr:LemA family protein [Coriobacteriia bacterium]
MPLWLPCLALGGIALVLALAVVAIYNRLVVLRNRVDNAWSQIDVQLKRRYDLIPNLVEAVKGYAAHESGVFEQVTEARSAAMSAQGVEAQGQAENQLSSALKSLFAVAEAYPDLKANTNFLDLQAQVTDSENKIAYARQFYNDSVMSLSTAIQTFPNNLLAGMFGFAARPYFEAETAANEVPQVKF